MWTFIPNNNHAEISQNEQNHTHTVRGIRFHQMAFCTTNDTTRNRRGGRMKDIWCQRLSLHSSPPNVSVFGCPSCAPLISLSALLVISILMFKCSVRSFLIIASWWSSCGRLHLVNASYWVSDNPAGYEGQLLMFKIDENSINKLK